MDCCINCPFCYITELPATTAGFAPWSFITCNYPIYNTSYDYLYSTSTWKPPNAA